MSLPRFTPAFGIVRLLDIAMITASPSRKLVSYQVEG